MTVAKTGLRTNSKTHLKHFGKFTDRKKKIITMQQLKF